MTLNEGQQNAVDTVVEVFKRGGKYALIDGAPGTGKTYTAKEAIKALLQNDLSTFDRFPKIGAVAPTNKAVKVLRKSFKEEGEGIEFSTMHSILGKEPSIDRSGRLVFNTGKDRFKNLNILLVDEISMLQKQTVEELDQKVYPYTKIILLGDKDQLSPFGEEESTAFNLVNDENSSTLTQIMRQAENNPIIEVIQQAKRAVHLSTKRTMKYDPRNSYSETMTDLGDKVAGSTYGYHVFDEGANSDALISQITNAYKKAQKNGTWDDVRTLAFRNVRVIERNILIHDLLWGNTRFAYCVGEPIMLYEPVYKKVLDERTGEEYNYAVLKVSDEVIIKTIRPINKTFDEKSWSGYRVEVDTELAGGQLFNVELDILPPRLQVEFDEEVEKYKRSFHKIDPDDEISFEKAKQKLDGFKRLFTNVRHGYAMTVSKSQGSTYKNVFIDGDDISNNRDDKSRCRHWYVCTSRATHRVLIY